MSLKKAFFSTMLVGTIFSLSFQQALAAASWTVAGDLNIARYSQAAILLSSGKVLVSGGSGASPLSQSETYNVSTHAWSYTGSLTSTRKYHAMHAVTLGGGAARILAMGGTGLSGALKTSELYNESTGTWGSGPAMFKEHSQFASVTLNDGKVLITGGLSASGKTEISELYDPTSGATGSWSTVASMSGVRAYHTATLVTMGDGSSRVLVTGGSNNSSALATTELYDPANNTWTSGPSMSYARTYHTATLLSDGKVLIVGGSGTAGTAAELYDPTVGTTGSWSSAGSLSYTRMYHSATFVTQTDSTSRVLVVGGTNTSLAKAELYNPSTNSWTTTSDLNTGRNSHTATLLDDGTVLVSGGIASGGTTKSTEYYTTD